MLPAGLPRELVLCEEVVPAAIPDLWNEIVFFFTATVASKFYMA